VFSCLTLGSAAAAQITETGGVITVRGELRNGDHIAFDRVAQKYSRGAVLFDSPGGSLAAGIGIGESIRLKGFATAVEPNGTCASSCALAWLGGARRFVSSSSKLGFHSAYRMDGTTPSGSGHGECRGGSVPDPLGAPAASRCLHLQRRSTRNDVAYTGRRPRSGNRVFGRGA
jgi:hypothetical protein